MGPLAPELTSALDRHRQRPCHDGSPHRIWPTPVWASDPRNRPPAAQPQRHCVAHRTVADRRLRCVRGDRWLPQPGESLAPRALAETLPHRTTSFVDRGSVRRRRAHAERRVPGGLTGAHRVDGDRFGCADIHRDRGSDRSGLGVARPRTEASRDQACDRG